MSIYVVNSDAKGHVDLEEMFNVGSNLIDLEPSVIKQGCRAILQELFLDEFITLQWWLLLLLALRRGHSLERKMRVRTQLLGHSPSHRWIQQRENE